MIEQRQILYSPMSYRLVKQYKQNCMQIILLQASYVADSQNLLTNLSSVHQITPFDSCFCAICQVELVNNVVFCDLSWNQAEILKIFFQNNQRLFKLYTSLMNGRYVYMFH